MNASSKHLNNHSKLKRRSPQLLPTLVAVGGACGLAAMPAGALELGDIQVNSALGQPLRASIAYALNPNEQIYSYCIYLRPGGTTSGTPSLNDAKISLTGNTILVTGKTPIREPILGMQIAVDCAYTPNLSREYTVLISPEIAAIANRSVAEGTATAFAPPETQSPLPVASEPRRGNRQAAAGAALQAPANPDLAENTRYRVQPGDTVSTIASRIQGRTIGLWPAVEIIVAANPDAFVNQDMNRLIAGSEILIPGLVEGSVSAAEYAPASPTVVTEDQESLTELLGDIAEPMSPEVANEQPETTAATDPATAENNQASVILPNDTSVAKPITNASAEPELRPGDVVIAPPVPGAVERGIADTANGGSPVAAPVINSGPAKNTGTSGAWNWLLWLGGTGVALIVGLLLFGRTIRERSGTSGGRAADVPLRRQDDDATQKTRTISDVDFEFEDTINATAISLDADLDAGTGLNSAAEMDVAQDFGFSSTGQVVSELDLEITEAAAREPEASPTDIIPPNHREEPVTIVESEELPSDGDNEEYDLSMIVDATKQPIGDYDATAKDLQAVRVDESAPMEEDYTLSSAVDYQVLEQDYQDEFTATQAANAEMERIALELASRIDDGDINVTTEIPAQDQNEEQATNQLPTVSDPDLTAELTANLSMTMEAENDSVADDDGSEITVEMSAAGSDITIDLPVESRESKNKRN